MATIENIREAIGELEQVQAGVGDAGEAASRLAAMELPDDNDDQAVELVADIESVLSDLNMLCYDLDDLLQDAVALYETREEEGE